MVYLFVFTIILMVYLFFVMAGAKFFSWLIHYEPGQLDNDTLDLLFCTLLTVVLENPKLVNPLLFLPFVNVLPAILYFIVWQQPTNSK